MDQIVSDVEIKTVNAGKMLAILVTESYEKMATAMSQLREWLDQKMIKPSGPYFSIFYDTIQDPEDKSVKFEVCVEVDTEIEGEDIIKYREDIVQESAVVTYRGPYDSINIAYDALFNWIQENNYAVAGASREVYIVNPLGNENVDHSTLVTEIQLPVTKKE